MRKIDSLADNGILLVPSATLTLKHKQGVGTLVGRFGRSFTRALWFCWLVGARLFLYLSTQCLYYFFIYLHLFSQVNHPADNYVWFVQIDSSAARGD